MLQKSTLETVAKFGREACLYAFRENTEGNGDNTIASCLGIHWRSVDRCIKAGRDIVNNDKGEASDER